MRKYSGLIVILAFSSGVALGRAGTTGDEALDQVLSWVAALVLILVFLRAFIREGSDAG